MAHIARNCKSKVVQNNANALLASTNALLDLANDAHVCGLLDIACSSNVCGEAWLKTFVDATKTQWDVVECSKKEFTFGDGNTLKSVETGQLHVVLRGIPLKFQIDVVKSPVPLLLPRPTLSKLGVVLHVSKGVVSIKIPGTTKKLWIKCLESRSHHLLLPLGQK